MDGARSRRDQPSRSSGRLSGPLRRGGRHRVGASGSAVVLRGKSLSGECPRGPADRSASRRSFSSSFLRRSLPLFEKPLRGALRDRRERGVLRKHPPRALHSPGGGVLFHEARSSSFRAVRRRQKHGPQDLLERGAPHRGAARNRSAPSEGAEGNAYAALLSGGEDVFRGALPLPDVSRGIPRRKGE